MRRDPRAYLWDIEQAAAAIGKFVEGVDRGVYAESEVVHSAVERKFEIIGEALGGLAKASPQLVARIPDFRDIIAFRNILIHGYAAIEHDRVWRTAVESLPRLREVVARLLAELEPP
jgi:uncharacterized protein with HEPN domain